ncbi:hypothetical protein Tco_0626119 [Tanacetum coccineum]|uniref:Uncharacterized protein n=1 Tax=Tanacetum coccineum TaxID=301880 RepID=A0ABQ4WIN4_9ASTR
MPLVRLEMRSRGFKASILLLISASWDSWDFLNQRLASIDDYRRKNDGVSKNEGNNLARLQTKWKDVEVSCGAAAYVEQKEEMWLT